MIIAECKFQDKIKITVKQVYHDFIVEAPGLIYLVGNVFINYDKKYFKAFPTVEQALKDYVQIINDLVNNWRMI